MTTASGREIVRTFKPEIRVFALARKVAKFITGEIACGSLGL
jgi:hypothetical protein